MNLAYDIALDITSGDICINEKDFLMIDNAERVAQQIKITLQFWLGEWFLNISDGVPYLEYILVKNPNKNHIIQIFTEKILSVEDVISIESIDITLNSKERNAEITYNISTKYGLITRKEVLGYARG